MLICLGATVVYDMKMLLISTKDSMKYILALLISTKDARNGCPNYRNFPLATNDFRNASLL
jgi:hypothetical protein